MVMVTAFMVFLRYVAGCFVFKKCAFCAVLRSFKQRRASKSADVTRDHESETRDHGSHASRRHRRQSSSSGMRSRPISTTSDVTQVAKQRRSSKSAEDTRDRDEKPRSRKSSGSDVRSRRKSSTSDVAQVAQLLMDTTHF